MKRLAITLAALFVTGLYAGTVHADDKKYSLQDLQALQKSKSWGELMAHLSDVAPAQRNADWNRLAEAVCTRPGSMDAYEAPYCMEPLKAVLASEPNNTDFAWKAGKWARLNMKSSEAVPFFSKAGLKTGDPRCKDDDVSLAVVSALGMPKDSYKEMVQQAQDIGFKKCWPETQSAILKELTANSYFSENACPDLKKKGALSKTDAPKCSAS